MCDSVNCDTADRLIDLIDTLMNSPIVPKNENRKIKSRNFLIETYGECEKNGRENKENRENRENEENGENGENGENRQNDKNKESDKNRKNAKSKEKKRSSETKKKNEENGMNRKYRSSMVHLFYVMDIISILLMKFLDMFFKNIDNKLKIQNERLKNI